MLNRDDTSTSDPPPTTMRRLRILLHLATALLLALQMARGGADMVVCLDEDEIHLNSAHPECCADTCGAEELPAGTPALSHDDCSSLHFPLPGHDHATAAPTSTPAAPNVPLLAIPEDAAPAKTHTDPPAPPPSPPCSDSLQPLLRRSVELRI